MVSYDALKLFDIPFALWFGVPPDPTALSPILIRARFGHVARKWFSPMRIQDEVVSLKDRFAIQYFVFVGWLNGIPIPRPEFVSLDQPAPIVHWISETLQTHGACSVNRQCQQSTPSCPLPPWEQGLDLTGNNFFNRRRAPHARKGSANNSYWCTMLFLPIFLRRQVS